MASLHTFLSSSTAFLTSSLFPLSWTIISTLSSSTYSKAPTVPITGFAPETGLNWPMSYTSQYFELSQWGIGQILHTYTRNSKSALLIVAYLSQFFRILGEEMLQDRIGVCSWSRKDQFEALDEHEGGRKIRRHTEAEKIVSWNAHRFSQFGHRRIRRRACLFHLILDV